MKKNLGDLRESYKKGMLTEADVDANPFQQFKHWFEETLAESKYEANAMHLSTVDADNKPQGRIVLLKHFDKEGFVFFTSYESSKGQAIAQNNHVALTFYWPSFERQVRIEGVANKVSQAVSEDYFYSRPFGSQVGAAVSPQSGIIENYQQLERAAEKLTATGEVKKPDYWGGYNVTPSMFEFWQGRENRLHDRIQYVFLRNSWQIQRLAP